MQLDLAWAINRIRKNSDPSKSYTDAYAYDPSSLDPHNNSSSQAGPSSYNYNNTLPSTHNNNNNAAGGNPNNVWEASIGFLRVDVLAGLGYLGGPITGKSLARRGEFFLSSGRELGFGTCFVGVSESERKSMSGAEGSEYQSREKTMGSSLYGDGGGARAWDRASLYGDGDGGWRWRKTHEYCTQWEIKAPSQNFEKINRRDRRMIRIRPGGMRDNFLSRLDLEEGYVDTGCLSISGDHIAKTCVLIVYRRFCCPALLLLIFETTNDYVRFHGKLFR